MNEEYVFESKKILNMATPTITVYPIIANPLSIMQNYMETQEWILSHFIQICSNGLALNFFDFNYKFCPFLNVQRISKNFLLQSTDILKFIVYSISRGYYVYLLANRSYISSYRFEYSRLKEVAADYKEEIPHDIMVYGYNYLTKEFYIADNFVNGKYALSTCGFKEMQEAILSVAKNKESRLGFNGCVELLEFHADEFWNYKFSIEYVHDSLVDYYTSFPMILYDRMEVRQEYGLFQWVYGLKCYDYLKYKVCNSPISNLKIQDFHLVWEHKKHLGELIYYLLNNGYIFDRSLYEKNQGLEKDLLVARDLVIKYALSRKGALVTRILDKYGEIEKRDKELIKQLIFEIEKCNKNYFWRKINEN